MPAAQTAELLKSSSQLLADYRSLRRVQEPDINSGTLVLVRPGVELDEEALRLTAGV